MKNIIYLILPLFLLACNPIPVVVPIPMLKQTGIANSHQVAVGIVEVDQAGGVSLLIDAKHAPINLSHAENVNGVLVVHGTTSTATKIHGFFPVGDECMARFDATGAKGRLIGNTISLDIPFAVSEQRFIGATFTYNGTNWTGVNYPRSEPFSITTNTASAIVLSHTMADNKLAITPGNPGLDLFNPGNPKRYETYIGIGGTPQTGAKIKVWRHMDINNPRTTAVPLDKVVGGPLCTIEVLIYYSE